MMTIVGLSGMSAGGAQNRLLTTRDGILLMKASTKNNAYRTGDGIMVRCAEYIRWSGTSALDYVYNTGYGAESTEMERVTGVLQKREKVRGPGYQRGGAGRAKLLLLTKAPQYAHGDHAGPQCRFHVAAAVAYHQRAF